VSRRGRKQKGRRGPAEQAETLRAHLRALGMESVECYRRWCGEHGFGASRSKTPLAMRRERSARADELAAAHLKRSRGVRDPAEAVSRVCRRALSAESVGRPALREVCRRIEAARIDAAGRAALEVLLRTVAREADFLTEATTWGGVAHRFIDALIALNERRAQWIRPLEGWSPRSHNRERQFSSLARHLLARYPLPVFMDSAWFRRDEAGKQQRDWFVHLGRGASLRAAATPIPLTRRMVHHFLQSPDHYLVEHALRWGQIHAMRGDARLVEAVIATRLGACFEHDEFWSSVLRFLVAHPLLDRAHVGPVVDYLQHMRFEQREPFVGPGTRRTLPPQQPNLSMRGRSPASLLRQVERWHGRLSRGVRGDLRWDASDIAGFELPTGIPGRTLRVWRLRELTSLRELVEEGRAMHHCVASYARSCASGRSSIWSMTVASFAGLEHRQTVEVSPRRVIVQSRGRCNARPTPQDRAMLRRWAAQAGLELRRWV